MLNYFDNFKCLKQQIKCKELNVIFVPLGAIVKLHENSKFISTMGNEAKGTLLIAIHLYEIEVSGK